MHCHLAETGLIVVFPDHTHLLFGSKDNLLSKLGGPNKQFSTHEKLPWCKACKISSLTNSGLSEK